jgi:hypothetical protein
MSRSPSSPAWWGFCINAVALGLIQLVSLLLGLLWLPWTIQSRPTAVLIPLPFLMGCFAWSLWCRAPLVRYQIRGHQSAPVSYLMCASIAVCCGLYGLAAVAGAKFSVGRLTLVCLWALLGSMVSLLLEKGLQDWSLAQTLRRRWCQRLMALVAGIIVCVLVIGVLETISGILLALRPAGPTKVYEGNYLKGDFFTQDRYLGIGLQPSREVKCRLSVDDRPLWDVSYGTDEFGRRRTINEGADRRDKFAAFFGCSFLFGEGADDQHTIPSEFARRRPDYLAFNYGVPGWGTQHMLALLEAGKLPRQVPLSRGLGVYLYLPGVHEARVVGDMDVVNSFGAGFPFYSLNGDGKPVRDGTFQSAQPVKLFVYGVLGESRTRKLLGLNFPARRPDHFRLTASVICKSEELFQKQFPGSDFIVVAFPSKFGPSITLSLCRERGLRVIDLTGLFEAESPDMQYVGDGHPTPAANEAVARAIAGALEG